MKWWQIAALMCVTMFVGYVWGYENGKVGTLNAKLLDKVDLYAYQRALSMESDPLKKIQLESKISFAELDIARSGE